MRPSRQSVTSLGDGCRGDRCRSLRADGGQRRGRFTLEQRVALAQLIWEAKGYETTARSQNGDTYVLAKNDEGTTELIRIAGERPSSEAPLGTIEGLREEYGFDAAYYFDPDRSLQPLEADVSVLDRRQIARIVTRLGIANRMDEESAAQSASTTAEPTDTDETPAFETGAPASSIDRGLLAYAVGVGLATVAVSGLLLGLISLIVPGVDLWLGSLLATGLGLGVGFQSYRTARSNRSQHPVLRIDGDGIHHRHLSGARSIPWERIVAVYLERRSVSVRGRQWSADWLAIEVTEFAGEDWTHYLDRLHTTILNRLLGTTGEYHRIRADQYEADFEEVRAAVERYSDVPVATRNPDREAFLRLLRDR
jgi:hypothetical protein